MKLTLKDIIDLDFFLDGDEDGEPCEDVGARDRAIYREVNRSGIADPVEVNDDGSLLLAWLEHRRQQFKKTGNRERLPGGLYHSLYAWMIRTAVVLGLISGFLTAYSFLAYHGSRPVNVTLFIAFFILFQALLAVAAGVVMVRQLRRGEQPDRAGDVRYSFLHNLVFEVFIRRLEGLAEKDEAISGLLDRFRSGRYKGLLFWSLFMVPILAGICFSLGCLGATLFRVMVTDLAFGWQSTLFTSGGQVHNLVSVLALPWSWIVPDGAALPTLAQVEGSRIILKQGIAGLSTEHLAAWWPFLCMGILVYGIFTRLIIAGWALRAGKKTLDEYDINRPCYRRLLMRMRSPRMDMEIRKTGGSNASVRPPVPDPALVSQVVVESETPVPRYELGNPGEDQQSALTRQVASGNETLEGNTAEFVPESRRNTKALVLASARSYPDPAMDDIAGALDRQLGIDMAGVTRVGFDFETDRPVLAETTVPENGVVVVLQEVWQPPIRGLLYYLTQLKKEIFPDHDLWLFLTRTPGEDEMAVDAGDMDFQVWKTAVAQLKDPGIIVERWML